MLVTRANRDWFSSHAWPTIKPTTPSPGTLATRRRKKTEPPPTANKLQILPTHMPTQKFATHLLLADTQENFIHMISDFNQQKDKKLAITENATIKWIYLYDITHIECDGYLISVFVDHLTVPYHYTNSLTVLLSELEDTGFV